MNIFLDTADLKKIETWVKKGIIDGVTTNPTHLSKEEKDPTKQILEICSVVQGVVSVEVTEQEPEALYKQAKEIAKLANNIVVKVPCYKNYYPVIKRLSDEGIKINATLVFTLIQGLMMCKLGAYFISPFVGRLDDIDEDGIALIAQMRLMIDTYAFETKLLAASIRSVRHVHDAINAGADAVTVPISILEKSLEHPLTDQGMKKFDADWKKMGIKKFP